MPILVAGVRQKSAPIEIREKFALTEAQIEQALPMLQSFPGIQECAILSTCNRTEIYACVEDTYEGLLSIKRLFLELQGVNYDNFHPAVFTLLQEDAIMHLYRVASGLDSLILGEGQILAQVKDTLHAAQQLKTAGVTIDRLFKSALSLGKRIRTETGIAQKDVSVSRAAYEFALQQVPDFLNQRIALVGGGKMASILMASLKHRMTPRQQSRVVILNRSESRLKALIDKYGFRGVTWEALDQVIAKSDVLFVATGAPHMVLGCEEFEGHLSSSKWVFDISVPRNVDPAVGKLAGLHLFNTDNLAGVKGFSPETQQQLIEQAQYLIDEEYVAFSRWLQNLAVVPAISQLRSKVEQIRQAEVASVSMKADQPFNLVDEVSRNLVNKILHEPIIRLKASRGQDESALHVRVLSDLFDICPEDSD